MGIMRPCQRLVGNDRCYQESDLSGPAPGVWPGCGDCVAAAAMIGRERAQRKEVPMKIEVRKVEAVKATGFAV
ncbi:hypothetical protein [Nonomuraea ceibae]|uniref:hypothetical protein n=1 Tax=Nonomuraea ceibae TaxID=1935170 RepID=UPI001C5D971A|nr:hypothetical protein [Nonomuraea ceibae]